MSFRVLILGGTGEGRQLAERLASDARFRTLLSFAGRTASPERPATPSRVGGFGGAAGLAAFLREGGYSALVDTTHPFAAQISGHAVSAAAAAGVPLLRLVRPLWRPTAGDQWIEVGDMQAAAGALGAAPRRVFLTIGRQEVAAFRAAPQHDYLLRAIDPFEPGLPCARVLASRGPFSLAAECELLAQERIELLVSKNAGTAATYPKLAAARALSVPVVMVARPRLPPAPETESLDDVLAWLEGLHGAARKERGE